VFVFFLIDALDESGEVVGTENGAFAGAQEADAARRYAAAFAGRGMAGRRETVLVGNKPVAATVFTDAETGAEFWFSDAVGVLNVIRYEPGEGDEANRLTTLDFGSTAKAVPAGVGGRDIFRYAERLRSH
jgi:hypothetical protein